MLMKCRAEQDSLNYKQNKYFMYCSDHAETLLLSWFEADTVSEDVYPLINFKRYAKRLNLVSHLFKCLHK